jgi:hypothetical protein
MASHKASRLTDETQMRFSLVHKRNNSAILYWLVKYMYLRKEVWIQSKSPQVFVHSSFTI